MKLIFRSFFVFLLVFSVSFEDGNSQSIQHEQKFSNDLLKTGFTKWMKKSSAEFKLQDTTIVSALLGDAVVQTYSTKEGDYKLIFHRNHEGSIYDVGLYFDYLHDITDEGGRFAVQVFERLLFALKTKDISYTDAAFASSDIILSTLLVGNKTEVLTGIFGATKGPFAFELNRYELKGSYHTFTISPINSKIEAISIGIKPSLGLVLAGQTFIYQSYLRKGFVEGKIEKSNDKPNRFTEYYSKKSDGKVECYETREYQPYLNDYCFEKTNTGLIPYFEKDEDLVRNLVTEQAYYWMSILLEEREKIEFPHKEIPEKVSVRLLDFDAIELALTMAELTEKMQAIIGKGLPTYYGVMKTRNAGDALHIVSVCSIVDPFLQIEHILRITDIIEDVNKNPTWKKSHIDGYLAIRLDNVSSLNGESSKEEEIKNDVPKISIDLRKN